MATFYYRLDVNFLFVGASALPSNQSLTYDNTHVVKISSGIGQRDGLRPMDRQTHKIQLRVEL